MAAIVVKLSGRAFDGSLDEVTAYLHTFAAAMLRLSRGFQLAITVGGGHRARELIQLAGRFEGRDVAISKIGGDVGLAHCRVMCAALSKAGIAARQPVQSWDKAAAEVSSGIVPVLYGYWPAMTSDSVAAYFADYVKARTVLKLSSVDAIYDRDPSLEGAEPLDFISHEYLEALALNGDRRIAGNNFVLDLLAARRLRESGITLVLGHMSRVDQLVSTLLEGTSTASLGSIVRSV